MTDQTRGDGLVVMGNFVVPSCGCTETMAAVMELVAELQQATEKRYAMQAEIEGCWREIRRLRELVLSGDWRLVVAPALTPAERAFVEDRRGRDNAEWFAIIDRLAPLPKGEEP